MEVDNENPSQIRSVLGRRAFGAVELNKKRKLELEQLGLPVPKHQCGNRSLPPKLPPIYCGNSEGEELSSCTSKGKTELGASSDGLEIESANDSNSFSGDSDCVVSVHGEAKSVVKDIKVLTDDKPSCSSSDSSSLESHDSSDAAAEITRNAEGEMLETPHHDVELKFTESLEDTLAEYGNHLDYIYGMEQCQDKEIEDIFYPNGVDPNPTTYVLSSGRWNVNEGDQQSARKPTIDQEFEQYFSMLML